jgi:hypothetical protein
MWVERRVGTIRQCSKTGHGLHRPPPHSQPFTLLTSPESAPSSTASGAGPLRRSAAWSKSTSHSSQVSPLGGGRGYAPGAEQQRRSGPAPEAVDEALIFARQPLLHRPPPHSQPFTLLTSPESAPSSTAKIRAGRNAVSPKCGWKGGLAPFVSAQKRVMERERAHFGDTAFLPALIFARQPLLHRPPPHSQPFTLLTSPESAPSSGRNAVSPKCGWKGGLAPFVSAQKRVMERERERSTTTSSSSTTTPLTALYAAYLAGISTFIYGFWRWT